MTLGLAAVVVAGAAAGAGAGQAASSPDAVSDIPPPYLALYQEAGARFGVPWGILAAIGRVESDHGRNPACYRPNPAGALGPMQFLPATFGEYAAAAGHPDADILNPADAIPAAAAMLAHNGIATDVRGAIYSYNHAGWYVDEVVRWAVRYGWTGPAGA
jgi:membrane-bound lytic murein transglycosylase B